MTLKRTFQALLLVSAALLFASPSIAREEILTFHSRIEVLANGELDVMETIRVRAEGDRIRRGIYRDFPTRYRAPDGKIVTTGFDVESVSMNGRPVAWHTQRQGAGIRLYIGDPDVPLARGEYTYRIAYRTPRQIRHFSENDELYFNAIGTEWAFPILQARAEVVLPAGAEVLDAAAYTGGFGEKRSNVLIDRSRSSDGHVVFEATRPLDRREGMSVVVAWPAGFVERPSAIDRVGYFLVDHLAPMIAWIGMLGLVAYYLLTWRRVGRDPGKGVIIARYEPPEGFSPAGCRFIIKHSYDDTTFTAAIVNMAVKAYLTIEEEGDKEYALKRSRPWARLTTGENAIAKALFDGGRRSRIRIHKDNQEDLEKAQSAHKSALGGEHLVTHFVRNRKYFVIGLIVSALVTFVTVLLADIVDWMTVVPLALMWLSNPIFAWLLKRPTVEGRKAMDEIEGFKRYLEFAEKDRMNFHNPPERTPALFERYLPFAIALGVEQEWGDQFDEVLAGAARDDGQQHYQPAWYHGRYRGGGLFHRGFAHDLSKGFSASFASAAAPSSSTSGFSGGFAGGGGGGGGGGGW